MASQILTNSLGSCLVDCCLSENYVLFLKCKVSNCIIRKLFREISQVIDLSTWETRFQLVDPIVSSFNL